jgi:hypothetical protein
VITGDDRWFQVCTRINTAVYTELTLKPCRYGVVPGLVAWDDCSCGILATTWAITMASEVFPQEKVDITGNCDAPWEVMEIAVQVIRCAPSPPVNNSKQLAPTVAALSAAARQMDIDGTQMIRAVSVLLCGMKDDYDIVDFMVNRLSALGPEGGCVGSELRALVALPRLTPKV